MRRKVGVMELILPYVVLCGFAMFFIIIGVIVGQVAFKQTQNEVNSKIKEWNDVHEQYPPKLVMDLLNSTLNWMYMTKLALEDNGNHPDLVDPSLKNLHELDQVLAMKETLGKNVSITFREYLASSSSEFLKMSQTFYGIKEMEIRWLNYDVSILQILSGLLGAIVLLQYILRALRIH